MKISSWQDIIISWANALRLLDEPVTDVLDLVKGSFFIKLLNKTKNVEREGESSFSEDDLYNVIENFLRDEFSGFRLLGYWDNDEVTLVSSVMLLWSTLENQSCRTPLYELDNTVQIKIQAFIQRFIETPQHLINRQLVMDAVLDITFDHESDDESLSFSSSPRTYSTPKRPSSSSNYSPAFFALSEVRSLRSKVDLLNCEKQHLQEELEVTRSQLSEAQNKLQQKVSALRRLSNQIACGDHEAESGNVNDPLVPHGPNVGYSSRNSSAESSLVKMELEELRDIVNKLRHDLESTIDENNNLNQQLSEERKRLMNSEQRCSETVSKNEQLSKKVEELESFVISLKKTCEEQSLILAERTKPVDDESLRMTDCETLEGVVDIKYSEIQEELRIQTELLEEKARELRDLQEGKENAENTIAILKKEIEQLKCDNIKKENINCPECEVLKSKISAFQLNYHSKLKECEKLKVEFVQNVNELKSLENIKSINEKKIIDLQRETTESMTALKEEIFALRCELNEKDNVIDFYRDETDFLNNCLASKTVELNNLESDYTKINRSKDREIQQLMKSVEHLNKEVRVLQEQLHEEFSKKDRHNQSTFDWRQKLSQGLVTVNDEIARELIALHESLQWKTLKIGELTLQIDQLKCEISDKETLNKELHERLIFISEKNKESNKELQTSKNTIVHLQSKVTSLEYSEKKLNQELVKKTQKFEAVDFELKELWKLLKQKFHTIDLEMDSCMLRGKSDLQDIINFIDFIGEKLKENRKNLSHLSIAINELEADNAEKTAELEIFENKIGKLTSVSVSKAVEHWTNENTFFHDRLKKIETDYENNTIKLQDTIMKLDKANEIIQFQKKKIIDLESKIDQLNKELKEKLQLVECLQQNINLYEHEKSILKKKLSNLSQYSEKLESGRIESLATSSDGSSGREAEEEHHLKAFGEQSDLEEKFNQGFQGKLLDLQAKMKAQHEEDVNKIIDEYKKKIDQLKAKVKKDCAHIEHLSSELWETSDRLLLAQQESEALRAQLKRTKVMLNEQNNRGTEDCSSFMWLGGNEAGNFVEEFVTTVSTKRTLHGGRLSFEPQNDLEDEDEMFTQQCLEDLKAGICRLPSSVNTIQGGRLSCPAESTRLDDESNTFLAPVGKPRKLKGSIMYRKPGPPTPSISAARHSLPGNELRKGLREHNTNISSGRSRLSQLFGSITLSKPKNFQDSPTPKTKRKGFFQRRFGNRENLPPKT